MRRRIWSVGAAIAAGSLAVGGAGALAASPKAASPKFKVNCSSKLAVAIAAGDTGVIPPVAQGSEYGSATCGKLLGSGMGTDAFTVPDSGDTLASYTFYFPTGSIHGKWDLTPQESGLTSFTSTDYLGTMTITGGTGAFAGAKGTATMKCTTPDNIHTSCKDQLKLSTL